MENLVATSFADIELLLRVQVALVRLLAAKRADGLAKFHDIVLLLILLLFLLLRFLELEDLWGTSASLPDDNVALVQLARVEEGRSAVDFRAVSVAITALRLLVSRLFFRLGRLTPLALATREPRPVGVSERWGKAWLAAQGLCGEHAASCLDPARRVTELEKVDLDRHIGPGREIVRKPFNRLLVKLEPHDARFEPTGVLGVIDLESFANEEPFVAELGPGRIMLAAFHDFVNLGVLSAIGGCRASASASANRIAGFSSLPVVAAWRPGVWLRGVRLARHA
mmetsp:Transcript_9235/g.29400  ORF Transcript_9235/g.29400 Transcript_9235/m.29400 type:complete len:282 (-) Transcript_9235:575-1420(-)